MYLELHRYEQNIFIYKCFVLSWQTQASLFYHIIIINRILLLLLLF